MPITLELKFDILEDVIVGLEENARDVVKRTAKSIRDRARQRIVHPPKTGRIYFHGPPPLPHQASAEGETPADWTGHLAQSIRYRLVSSDGSGTTYEVGVGAYYGAMMEFGTIQFGPRPFFIPTVEEIFPQFIEQMRSIAAGTAFYRAAASSWSSPISLPGWDGED